jgi:hypothetical protein
MCFLNSNKALENLKCAKGGEEKKEQEVPQQEQERNVRSVRNEDGGVQQHGFRKPRWRGPMRQQPIFSKIKYEGKSENKVLYFIATKQPHIVICLFVHLLLTSLHYFST